MSKRKVLTQSTAGVVDVVSLTVNGIPITCGTGEPATTPANGSIYIRTDGGVLTTVYARVAGAWVGIA